MEHNNQTSHFNVVNTKTEKVFRLLQAFHTLFQGVRTADAFSCCLLQNIVVPLNRDLKQNDLFILKKRKLCQ